MVVRFLPYIQADFSSNFLITMNSNLGEHTHTVQQELCGLRFMGLGGLKKTGERGWGKEGIEEWLYYVKCNITSLSMV